MPSGRAEFLLDHDLIQRQIRLRLRVADDDAFAQGQPVGLDGATSAERLCEIAGGADLGENAGMGGGNAVFLHELLGKDFGRLELRALPVRPPDAERVGLEEVHHAQGERVIGTDYRQRRLVFACEREKGGQVIRGDGRALNRGAVAGEAFAGDAGVARGAEQFCNARRLGQFPNQGMLASARADDQNIHHVAHTVTEPWLWTEFS